MKTRMTHVFVLAFATLAVMGCEPVPKNVYFADSVAAIGHFNSAQSTSVDHAGPEGPSESLTEAAGDLTYTHMGPAHFGLAISPKYPNGDRTIWSNGGDRVSKLDYNTLEVIDEYPLPGKTLQTSAQADADIASLDSLSGEDLANAGIGLAAQYLTALSGIYYLLDDSNTLFVGGADSILSYGDVDPTDPNSPIEFKGEWLKPAGVTGGFVGANLTYDGKICMVSDEGWVVVVERDFSSYSAIQLETNGVDPAQHNADKIAEGFRPGAASWVRNSAAIDDQGGIYVPSFEHMHKVVWNGTSLSKDPLDGAWVAPYSNSLGKGSGSTPSLMGFGPDEPHFVVLTDGDAAMNLELFWRDEIPQDWVPPVGALSDRTAGKAPVTMNGTVTDIQTEQSVVVGRFNAFVVNNEPTSIPAGYPAAATTVLIGYAGSDPAFTPKGVEMFNWNFNTQELVSRWSNTAISSVNSVPVYSLKNNTIYTVGARNGDWTLEAINAQNGASKYHHITGSNRYNSLYSGLFLDEEGRVIHTTAFGILRYERFPPAPPAP